MARITTSALAVMALLAAGGCSAFSCCADCFSGGTVTLNPMTPDDIFSVTAGTVASPPGEDQKQIKIKKDGWFVSDLYLEKVLEARVEK
jgi:hypothetical protein